MSAALRGALEQLKNDLQTSEACYEQLLARLDVVASATSQRGRELKRERGGEGERDPHPASASESSRVGHLGAVRQAFEYALGVTARLIARIEAALDPHMDWEEQAHINAGAEAEEMQCERRALSEWYEFKYSSAPPGLNGDGETKIDQHCTNTKERVLGVGEQRGVQERGGGRVATGSLETAGEDWQRKIEAAFVRCVCLCARARVGLWSVLWRDYLCHGNRLRLSAFSRRNRSKTPSSGLRV